MPPNNLKIRSVLVQLIMIGKYILLKWVKIVSMVLVNQDLFFLENILDTYWLTSFVDYLCYLCLVFAMLSLLFIAALWSPEGQGLTSWLLFVMLM